MSFNASYKRYWEPSLPFQMFSSLIITSAATTATYPLEFLKTKIQVRAEGYGINQVSVHAGYNPVKVFRQLHAAGYGTASLFTGFQAGFVSRTSYLFVRNF